MLSLGMVWIFFFVLIEITALRVHSQSLSPEETKEFRTKMTAETAKLKAFSTDFKQVRSLKAFNDSVRSSGQVLFQFPSKLRWETREPLPSLLIYRDGEVAKFQKQKQSWKKLNYGAGEILVEIMRNILRWSKGDFSEAEKNYQLSYKIGYQVEMIPKNEKLRQSIGTITIDIDKKSFLATKVTIGSTDKVEIKFFNFKRKERFAKKLFDTNNP